MKRLARNTSITISSAVRRSSIRSTDYYASAPELRLFELYEFWIENRVMLELATEDMIPAYARIANGAAQREILARRRENKQAND